MSTTISRTKAKRLTLLYQLIAGVCVLGAIALGVVGLPESATAAKLSSVSESASNTPDRGGQAVQQTKQGPATKQTARIRVDPGSIAARLAMLDNAPEVTTVPDLTPTIDPTPTTTTEQGTLAKRVRYTGYIEDSEQPMAFIRIDGTQRIVPEGGVAQAGSMSLDDLTVKGVRPSFILITDGQIEERIKLSTKTGPSVTMSGGGEIEVVRVPQTEAEVVLTPEQLAELAEMPARGRAMRERIMRREAMGKPLGTLKNEPLASFNGSFNKKDANSSVRRSNREQPNNE
jgi:hypothetical protein